MSPAERSLKARLAAYAMHARHDSRETSAPGRAAFKAINREPVRYLAPFIFTAVIGVIASLALLVVAAVPSDAPGWLRGVTGCLAGFFVTWTIASLLPDLKMLVDFVGLKMDATEVPDDVGLPQSTPRRIVPRGQGEA